MTGGLVEPRLVIESLRIQHGSGVFISLVPSITPDEAAAEPHRLFVVLNATGIIGARISYNEFESDPTLPPNVVRVTPTVRLVDEHGRPVPS